MIHRHRQQYDQRHRLRHCSVVCALALLLLPRLAQAQDGVAATAGESGLAARAFPQQDSGPLASPASPDSGSSAEVAPLALQGVAAIGYSMPAGVCPVITDYLYQQCQQNPADAMCAPATGTE